MGCGEIERNITLMLAHVSSQKNLIS